MNIFNNCYGQGVHGNSQEEYSDDVQEASSFMARAESEDSEEVNKSSVL